MSNVLPSIWVQALAHFIDDSMGGTEEMDKDVEIRESRCSRLGIHCYLVVEGGICRPMFFLVLEYALLFMTLCARAFCSHVGTVVMW
jgi:hypothetical protein